MRAGFRSGSSSSARPWKDGDLLGYSRQEQASKSKGAASDSPALRSEGREEIEAGRRDIAARAARSRAGCRPRTTACKSALRTAKLITAGGHGVSRAAERTGTDSCSDRAGN